MTSDRILPIFLLLTAAVRAPGAQILEIELPHQVEVYQNVQASPASQVVLADRIRVRWPGLEWAPGLVEAARFWAAATADLGAVELPPSFLETVLVRTGNPEPRAFASALNTGSVEEVFDHVAKVVESSAEPLTHVGLARIDHEGGSRWGMVLSRRLAEVEPFPSMIFASLRASEIRSSC